MAQFPADMDRVFTAYIGVQQRGAQTDEGLLAESVDAAVNSIQRWIAEGPSTAPASIEQFQVLDGDDVPNSTVWVCYWNEASKYEDSIRRLSLVNIHQQLSASHRESVGLWCERFASHLSRVETNYSGLDYLPGLARLPGVSTVEHTLTAYWGAARDRIPASATDRFAQNEGLGRTQLGPEPASPHKTSGYHVVGTNPDNIVHIRSGQLRRRRNERTSGAMGLRYLYNRPLSSGVREKTCETKESCVAGFFRNLADLEHWAKSHPSHLAIYTGAIKHAKKFGERRKFRTWHEVSVLKHGEAHFEYVNCVDRTVMAFDQEGTAQLTETTKSYEPPPIYDTIADPIILRTLLVEDIYRLGGQFAILCQFAHPALAKGSYNHSNFATRIPNRLQNTARFLNAAVFGTQQDKAAIFSIIHRYHARVRAEDYDANDPELHKWTAATLFVAVVIVHETFFGELPRDKMEALYRESAVFGTSLRMPPEMWPTTLAEFWEYWNHNIETLEVTDMAQKLSRDLLYPVHLPMWMRVLAPLSRLLTIYFLPERLAKEYDLQPTMLSRIQFQATVRVMRIAYPSMPQHLRQTLHRQYMEDLGKAVDRIRKTGHWAGV
ncbi:hypothetical protein LV164_004205 [Aspergillus fumigatus]|nr:hypothetical protein LV164_004205 [Aspergillus fumigatus]